MPETLNYTVYLNRPVVVCLGFCFRRGYLEGMEYFARKLRSGDPLLKNKILYLEAFSTTLELKNQTFYIGSIIKEKFNFHPDFENYKSFLVEKPSKRVFPTFLNCCF